MQNNINYQGIQDLVLMLGFLGTFVGYFFFILFYLNYYLVLNFHFFGWKVCGLVFGKTTLLVLEVYLMSTIGISSFKCASDPLCLRSNMPLDIFV